MAVGKKGGGKHWTASQIAARQRATSPLTREQVTLPPPSWLGKTARDEWERIVRDPIALEMLDDLHDNTLAMYCTEIETYRELAGKLRDEDTIRLMQASAKLIASLADKLGFTPQARARLAQRRASQELNEDAFGAEFDQ